jgi:hypothetical protein
MSVIQSINKFFLLGLLSIIYTKEVSSNTKLFLDMQCVSDDKPLLRISLRNIGYETVSIDKAVIGIEPLSSAVNFYINEVVKVEHEDFKWWDSPYRTEVEYLGSSKVRSEKGVNTASVAPGDRLDFILDVRRDYLLKEGKVYSFGFEMPIAYLTTKMDTVYSIESNTVYIGKSYCSELGLQRGFTPISKIPFYNQKEKD